MTEISRMAKLSREYTNHSCRATTMHVLDKAQVPSRHIMSVTGHKSESSLKTYSGKTCEKYKMKYIFNPSIIQGFTCYHFCSYKREVWYTVKPGLTHHFS
jgi:hypothetical protein